MNNIQVFLTTRVINTGRLAAIGNFFLAPTRWLFSGSTIRVNTTSSSMPKKIESDQKKNNEEKSLLPAQTKTMTGIAEVQSFSYGEVAQARHYPELKSTDTDYSYGGIVVVPFLLIANIPGIVLGPIIKLLSYINNPIAQDSHQFVKKMLTPENKKIDLRKHQKKNSTDELNSTQSSVYESLHNISVSGQHVNALSILGDTTLTNECSGIIRKIQPSKLILGRKVKAKEWQFSDENWDNEALRPPVGGHDYSGLGWECKNKDSSFKINTRKKVPELKCTIQEEKKRDWNLREKDSSRSEGTLFYYPSQKKVPLPPTIVSSNQEALQHVPWAPHTVYVVKKR